MGRHMRRVAFVAVFALPLAGCGNSPAPAAGPLAAATPATPTASAAANAAKPAIPGVGGPAAATVEAAPPAPGFKYEAKGRRDPFAPADIQDAAKGPSVSTAKLRGIVTGSSGFLALIDTAEGVGYILKRGDTLVDGRLVDINQDSVVFAVASKPGAAAASNRITLRLPQD
jgi:hypothetical protein